MRNSSHATQASSSLHIVEFVSLMALMTSFVALSLDAMLPALNQIGEALQADSLQQVHLIVSVFFVGMGIGQLFFGPFADAKGRRAAILLGLNIFAVGTLVCMLATSMEMLILGRVVQAIGVAGPRIASMAIIRDIYVGNAMARVMSFIMMVFILVPMLAPIIGQIVLHAFSWRHIFTLFLIMAVFVGLWFFIRQPETLPAHNRPKFRWKRLKVSCFFIFRNRMVMGYTLAMGCIFGSFLSYLSASQTIFQTFYQTGDNFPYYFAILAFSVGLASLFNGTMVMRVGMKRLCRSALYGVISFSLIFTALIHQWNGLPPLWMTVVTMFCGFFFIGILFGNLNALAMQPLGNMAGLGAAIIGSLSSLLAVPIAMAIDNFIHTTLYPIGVGFMIFASLAFVAVNFAERD
ncbi:multidrug effflux MFS transporter [Alteromonas sp. ASW11-130]|uniref:multidrug effflux MFS transporter n=1 Tax=Alteromonas sp. ASW11-130 TaxID=3015775 RepID=UPI002242B805|nr:multidrug effflux MFS transporter [Alteromonas sp. ASW11-130]MCW8093355.1 multidrug effflux MFS transporter [Alteromonas sp. ASW11-130]